MRIVGYSIILLIFIGITSSLGSNDAFARQPKSGKDKKITICHYPPGNPSNVQTISIATSAWPAHKAHGDLRGECDGEDHGDDDHGGKGHDKNCDHGDDGSQDGTIDFAATLIGPGGSSSLESCPGEETELTVTITGNDAVNNPWTVTYTDGSNNYELIMNSTSSVIPVSDVATYSLVSITDADNNSGDVSGSVALSHFDTPTAKISGYDFVCSGESGKVYINMTGTGPWEVEYTDGTDNYSFTSTSSYYGFYTNAGNYSLISVKDANCEGTVSGSATIIENPVSTATITGDATICDEGTAPITINLTGAAPWTVVYSDGNQAHYINTSDDSYTFYAGVGTYTLISISDANCCDGIATGSVTISGADKPQASIAGNFEVCPGENAEVTVSLTGNGPWDFGYTDGTQYYYVSSTASEYTLELPVGTYALTEVYDSNCSGEVTGTAIVEETTIPTAFLSGSAEACEGTTSSLTVELTGTAPWDIVYSDGTNDYSVSSTDATYQFDAIVGTYYLISVSDANCSGTVSGNATVSATPKPTASIDGNYSICEGTTADIVIEFTGSAPWNATYTNGNENFDITSQEPTYTIQAGSGTYSLVSVNDAKCDGLVSGVATVSTIDKPTATITGSGEVCEGNTSLITIELTGTAPWSFNYTDGTDTFSRNSDVSEFTFDASAGTYTLVSVTDANCSGTVSGSATISVKEKPTAFISGDANVCDGGTAPVSIALTGTAPWTVIYTNGSENFEETINSSSISIDAPIGNYSLVSVNDANCEGTVSGSATISEVGGLSGEIALNNQYCLGELITVSSTLPQIGTTFSWSTDGLGTLNNANSATATYVSSENDNNVTFTLVASNACNETTISASTEIIIVSADFEVIPEIQNNELTVGLDYTFLAPFGYNSYSWRFGDGTASASSMNTATHSYNVTGDITVTLGVNKGACYTEVQKNFTVIDNQNLFVPNVISPLSTNEENNKAKVYGENISPSQFSFEVYNRWGLLVYQTTNLNEAQTQGWNGNSKNEESENNVFTYIVRGSFNDGDSFEKTGTITLIK